MTQYDEILIKKNINLVHSKLYLDFQVLIVGQLWNITINLYKNDVASQIKRPIKKKKKKRNGRKSPLKRKDKAQTTESRTSLSFQHRKEICINHFIPLRFLSFSFYTVSSLLKKKKLQSCSPITPRKILTCTGFSLRTAFSTSDHTVSRQCKACVVLPRRLTIITPWKGL